MDEVCLVSIIRGSDTSVELNQEHVNRSLYHWFTDKNRTVPTFASAHTFCASSRKAWMMMRATVDIDVINHATKYAVKLTEKFSTP